MFPGISITDLDPPQRTQIKDELVKLAEEIQYDDGVNDDEGLKRAVQVLKNVRMKSDNVQMDEPVPEDFKCYLSQSLIQDPVILDTGCTYDRASIEHHLRSGRMDCPESKQKIGDTRLIIPNRILKKLISNWCSINGVEYPAPKPDSEPGIDLLILNLPKCTLPEKQSAVKELVVLTKRTQNHPRFIMLKEPIIIVLYILLENHGQLNPEFHVDLLTLILNLSKIKDLRKGLGESSQVIPFVIESLKEGTPIEVSIIACQIVRSLSELEANVEHLLNSETSKALLRLLHGSDNPNLVNAVVKTLVKLCRHFTLLERAISEGIHRLALNKLKNQPFFEGAMLDILTLFSDNADILTELMELNATPALVRIIKKLECTEEAAVALMCDMCELNEDLIELFRDDIEFKEALNAIAQTGTDYALPKAVEIIAMMGTRSLPMRRYNLDADRKYGSSSRTRFG